MKKLAAAGAIALLGPAPSDAQWAIGAGAHTVNDETPRFAYYVFADPLPGREVEFNEWYLNVHLGDVVQLPGWDGAQRFRLVTDVMPRRSADGRYRHSYAVLWNQHGDAEANRQTLRAAIAGGKSRKGAGFDYTPGASESVTYKVATPRMVRPDGKPPAMPADSDTRTPRPNRYLYLEMVDPPAGMSEANFDVMIDRRIRAVLALPGWMAAQRLQQISLSSERTGPYYPRVLIQWETEGASAAVLAGVLRQADAARALPIVPIDEATVQRSWWQPISPYITKADIAR